MNKRTAEMLYAYNTDRGQLQVLIFLVHTGTTYRQ
jgi:hypothetical protein